MNKAKASDRWNKCQAAIDDEFNSLRALEAYTSMTANELPPNCQVLPSKIHLVDKDDINEANLRTRCAVVLEGVPEGV